MFEFAAICAKKRGQPKKKENESQDNLLHVVLFITLFRLLYVTIKNSIKKTVFNLKCTYILNPKFDLWY